MVSGCRGADSGLGPRFASGVRHFLGGVDRRSTSCVRGTGKAGKNSAGRGVVGGGLDKL